MIFSLEKKREDAPAILTADGTIVTYGELRNQAEQFGTRIRLCGTQQSMEMRCLIFCICRNEPGAVMGYLGGLENNAVPMLLGSDIGQRQFEKFFETYEPEFLWAPNGWVEENCHRKFQKIYETYGYVLWKTVFPSVPMNGKLALLLATSGSTGDSKLVRLSRENLVANAESILTYLKLQERERPITTLPMQYTYGLSVINSHFLAGACILMTTASMVQREFWDFFEKEKATSFAGVPYTYEILKRMGIFERKFPSLNSITQAGGKLSPVLQKKVGTWAKEQGIDFFVMYGQTEATARMSYLPPERCLDKIGSIGIQIPGGRFALEDGQGREIDSSHTVGELVYYGANVSLGYAQSKLDLQCADERKGRLLTGDMAMRDSEGYYYIIGRKKRFIKIFGVRVALDECEQVLTARFPEAEFACTGTDDRMEIYTTDREIAEYISEFLSGYLQLNQKAFTGYYISDIPKNASGKILYMELKHEKKSTSL